MSRALVIQKQLQQILTVGDLTSVFEGIASLHISRVRNRVVASQEFFSALWQTYSGLRVDPKERLRRDKTTKKGRSIFVAVTSEDNLSLQLSDQVTDTLLQDYLAQNPATTDVVVVGTQGVSKLRRHDANPLRTFHLPPGDMAVNIDELLQFLTEYETIQVFYQAYESLRVQKVVRIELFTAVRALSKDAGQGEILSSNDFIFEPNINEIADYMEGVMMGVALTQIIMESKLANYAARFNAMGAARKKAEQISRAFRQDYYRAKRYESDERTKELMKVTKLRKQGAML